MTLEEIDAKIKTLDQRYAELDAKLCPKFDGRVDFTVEGAMRTVNKEIDRLRDLREKALVADLIEDAVPPPAAPPVVEKPAPVRAAKAYPPQRLDYQDLDLSDPLLKLERLPTDEAALAELQRQLLAHCMSVVEDIAFDFTGFPEAAALPAALTLGHHKSLLYAIAAIRREVRWAAALGRDRRNELAARVETLERERASERALVQQLLKRLDRFERRPLMEYRGVWSEGTEYREGALVTADGAGWVCVVKSTKSKPPGDGWKLAIKSYRPQEGGGVKGGAR